MNVSHISCVHNAALNDGGWILPSSAPCTSTTSPIQCTNVPAVGGPTNIALQRVDMFNKMELVYKCCLPNDCDNGPTDIIIANIYGKLIYLTLKLDYVSLIRFRLCCYLSFYANS